MRRAATASGRLSSAVQGGALAALVYLALYALGVWKLGALAFGPWLWVAVVVGLAAGALGGWRARAASWVVAGLVVVVVLLVASTPLALLLARPLERRDVAETAPLPSDVDAVVALSADLRDDGLVAGEGIERLLDALRLARAAGRPLVVTVIHPPSLPAVSSLPDQRALVTLAGVAPLYAVDSVNTTHDEAVRVAALAAHERWRRVAIVTSPLHSARACATFERAGVRVLCMPAHSRLMTLDGPHALHGGPERLRAFGEWLYERLGWWSYRVRGWV